MKQRILIIFTLAVIFSVGGTLSLFAQQEEPVASEGDPTMPTTESADVSKNTPKPPFGAGPAAFAGQAIPHAGRARAFQGKPMMPLPPPDGPMFFTETPMFFHEHHMSFREGPMAFRGRSKTSNEENMINLEALMEYLMMELELTEEQTQKLQEFEATQMGQHSPFRQMEQTKGFQQGTLNRRMEAPNSREQISPRNEGRMAPPSNQTAERPMRQGRQAMFFDRTPMAPQGHHRMGPPSFREQRGPNFLDMHAAMTDMLQQEEFDEQEVRELFRQQATQWEEGFVERLKMFAEIKKVLSPEQINTLQEKGDAFIDMMERWHGAGQ